MEKDLQGARLMETFRNYYWYYFYHYYSCPPDDDAEDADRE